MFYIVYVSPIYENNAKCLSKHLNIPYYELEKFTPNNNDIVFIFGANKECIKLDIVKRSITIHYIIVQTEQISSDIFDNKYYLSLLENSFVFDWSLYNISFYKKYRNINCYSCYFFEPFVPEIIPKMEERTLDFFFTGTKTKYREIELNLFKSQNKDFKCEFDLEGKYMNQTNLIEKLKKTKYVLNMSQNKDLNTLETHRIHQALACGCKVISTLSSDEVMNHMYKPYIYFVKHLYQFSLLLEQEDKKEYSVLLEDFGTFQIKQNIDTLQNLVTVRNP